MKQKDFVESVLKKNFVSSSMESEIIPIGNLSASDVLNIYHSDYMARMTEAIGELYETVWFTVGDEEFFSLCKDYINLNPSTLRDLNCYAENFPDYIKSHTLIEDIPYLSDVANFEKTFWKLFHCNVEMKEQVAPRDLENSSCDFSNAISLYGSEYNILSLWNLRKGKITEEQWDNDIDIELPNFLCLYRNEDQVFIESFLKDEFIFFQLLKKGLTIGEALVSCDISSESVMRVFAFLSGPLKGLVAFKENKS